MLALQAAWPRPAAWRVPQCRHNAPRSSAHLRQASTAARRNIVRALAAAAAMADRSCPRNNLFREATGIAQRRSFTSSARQEATKRTWQSDRSAQATAAPTPKAIAAHLDEYVIGQTRAKRALSVGVYNHYLRLASLQRQREAKTAAVADSEMEAASAAVQVIAHHEQVDMASSSGGTRSPAGAQQDNHRHTNRDANRDALLTDYVGQASGSKRWATRQDEQKAGSSLSRAGPLAPAYFSSAKWPAFADNSRSAKSRRELLFEDPPTPRKAEKALAANNSGSLPDSDMALEKSNILVIGPSGSGKTHLVRTLASVLSVPFVHADATPLTSAGYVGEDVESILGRLLEASDWNVEKAERGIICIDEIDKLASPATSAAKGGASLAGRDVGGTGVQQALLRMLEGTVISIPDKRAPASTSPGSGTRSPRQGGSIKPWWSPEMQALHAEQGRSGVGASNSGRSASSERLPLEQNKDSAPALPQSRHSKRDGSPGQHSSASAIGHGGGASSISTAADGSGTIKLDTSNILFVCCGAFAGLQEIIAARTAGSTLSGVEADDLTKYGLIPEFVGRLPVMVTLDALTQDDLVRILTEPRNALVTQYQNLFASYHVKLHFTPAALSELAHQASQLVGASSGARSLRRLLEARLLDPMYEAPGGGVRYALMDKRAAMGEREVQLFSRGGRSAWLQAMEDDEAGEGIDVKKAMASQRAMQASPATTNTASPSSASSASRRGAPTNTPSSPRAGVFGRIDETMLRRRARARLTRPSRVGNLRILTSDS